MHGRRTAFRAVKFLSSNAQDFIEESPSLIGSLLRVRIPEQ